MTSPSGGRSSISKSTQPSDYGDIARNTLHVGTNHPGDEQTDQISRCVDDNLTPSHILKAQDAPTGQYRSLSRGASTRTHLPNHILDDETANLERVPLLRSTDGTAKGHEETMATWWAELWILSKYTLPVFGTSVLEHSFVIASVVSLGHLSTTALAASMLGSMTASVTGLSILQGFVSCLDTLLPGAWTSSHPELVGLWSQRMAIVLIVLCFPIAGIWFNAEHILLFLRQDPEIARLAGLYLRWFVLGLPAYGFNNLSRRYFQSQGLFAVPTHIVMVIAPINALLNYLLVWGPMPIRLGFIGAPIATALSFNLMTLSSVLYGIYWTPAAAWHPFSSRSFKSLGTVIQLGLAGVGQLASEWWFWELIGLAASFLGPTSLAAQAVLVESSATSFQAPLALGMATSVRVGNLLGEQNSKRAEIAARVSLLMTLGIAVILSTIFITFKHKWGFIFNDDPEVVDLVASILPLVALSQVFDGLSVTGGGILRARGRQSTGAVLNISAYYIIGIPLGLYLTFVRDMKLPGLWIGLTAALVYCAVISVWLCIRVDWDKEVQKVQDRIEREEHIRKRLAEVIEHGAGNIPAAQS